MARIQIPAKIRIEDFKSEEKDLISKIAEVYNPFIDNITQAVNGGLDITNLNRQIVDITIQTSNTGTLINPPQIKTTVIGKVRGINVLNALNTQNSAIFPTSSPFVGFGINGSILSILYVSGLQNNSEYRLTLELVV
jgi:hypothetical protein